MASPEGLEPPLSGPKPLVLPLHQGEIYKHSQPTAMLGLTHLFNRVTTRRVSLPPVLFWLLEKDSNLRPMV